MARLKMNKKISSDLQISKLKPTIAQYEVRDSKISGLTLRVSPKGKKTFYYNYRFSRQKHRRVIGEHPYVTLSQARDEAHRLKAALVAGHDPKQKSRQAYTANDKLYAKVAAEYIERYAKKRTRSWKETERILIRQIAPYFPELSVDHLSRKAIKSVLSDIEEKKGPSAANHAFAAIRHLLHWCIDQDYLEHSPCAGMKAPAKKQKRQHVLSDDDLAAILKASAQLGYPHEQYLKLLVLTAQRRSEVAHLKWEHINLNEQTWTQPADSNKSRRVHVVPLSDEAIDVIKSLPSYHGSEYVFPARGRVDRPMSGFNKWKKKLDELSGVKGWTLHDLRRTAATGMARLGCDPHVIELVLNHSSVATNGVAGVYNTYRYLEEKRKALNQWAAQLTKK